MDDAPIAATASPRERYLGFLAHRARGPSATVAVPGWLRWIAIVAILQLAGAVGIILVRALGSDGNDANDVALPIAGALVLLAIVLGALLARYLTWTSQQWLASSAEGAKHAMVVALLLGGVGAVAFILTIVAMASSQPAGLELALHWLVLLLCLVMVHGCLMVILNRNKSLASRDWKLP